jgi:hypothetical protein
MADANLLRVGRASVYPKMGMNLGGPIMYGLGISEAVSIGNPAPSMLMQYPAIIRFRWVVLAGSRSAQVDVMQASNVSPRPKLTVKANADIGVGADVTGSASSSTGWVTIGPLSVTPSSRGVLIIELECPTRLEGDNGCYWDNLITS